MTYDMEFRKETASKIISDRLKEIMAEAEKIDTKVGMGYDTLDNRITIEKAVINTLLTFSASQLVPYIDYVFSFKDCIIRTDILFSAFNEYLELKKTLDGPIGNLYFNFTNCILSCSSKYFKRNITGRDELCIIFNFRNCFINNFEINNVCVHNVMNFRVRNVTFFEDDFDESVFRGSKFKNHVATNCSFNDVSFSQSNFLSAPSKVLAENFEHDEHGIYAYKTFGDTYSVPLAWVPLEYGKVITEAANPDRFETCGCGINMATPEWVLSHTEVPVIFKMFIPWEHVCDIVVPNFFEGKIRSSYAEIRESYSREEFRDKFLQNGSV